MRPNNSKLIIITGPSGSGKTYLANYLIANYPTLFMQAKVHTTRKPRIDELKTTDRIFVTSSQFTQIKRNDEFLLDGKFDNQLYGWHRDSLRPTRNTYIITNIWPELLPDSLTLGRPLILALTVSQGSMQLLIDRMTTRGASPKNIQRRLKYIHQDIADIDKYRDIINQRGKIFIINDDTTIKTQVLPWLLKQISKD